MFRNREDAGRQLAARFTGRQLRDPLVLAIPRGGVVVGAALARELDVEFDVVLARKLRAPGQPQLAIGAISETGEIHLNSASVELTGPLEDYLSEECKFQFGLLVRRQRRFRKARPRAPVAGRSVIVADDGIATGSTMIAALQAVRAQRPHEAIVAVPVAPTNPLKDVRRWCDDVVCLLSPEVFWGIGQYYTDFAPVDDEGVVRLLRPFAGRIG
jgi:predicted phosphoribosyltransferase